MKRKLIRQHLYILLVLINKIIILLPLTAALGVGKFFGFLAYLILPKYSKIAKENLTRAFGSEKTPQEINKIALNVFCNLGMSAAEILSMPKIKRRSDKIIYSAGFEKIDNALKQKKGAIVVSAHFGNWELLPIYFMSRGYPSNFIARRLYYEKYDEWVKLMREHAGANVIYREESPRKIIEVLKKNELLGIMPDQDIDSIDGVFVNFFNRPAYTPSAPAAIAMKMGCPILPCFIVREGPLRHKIIIEDPVPLVNTGNQDEDVKTNTQRWSSVVESYIRKYPEQWVWMHKRWKTKSGQ